MPQIKISRKNYSQEFLSLVDNANQYTLIIWSTECAKRVLPFFKKKFPKDSRPEDALLAAYAKMRGEISMLALRMASLSAHAAARDCAPKSAAQFAARACGQAAGTAHVKRHAIGGAIYALAAIQADNPGKEDLIEKEKKWQYEHLLYLQSLDKSEKIA